MDLYIFEWDLKLDIGCEEQSPLISGTFPWQRARDVVAWARGAKSGVDFFGMLSPLTSVSSSRWCSGLCWQQGDSDANIINQENWRKDACLCAFLLSVFSLFSLLSFELKAAVFSIFI